MKKIVKEKSEFQKFENLYSGIEPKYYFVYYECEVITNASTSITSSGPITSSTMKCQGVIDIHPLQFQLSCNEKYGMFHDNGHGGETREYYTIISWQKLTLEEYKEFKGKIG